MIIGSETPTKDVFTRYVQEHYVQEIKNGEKRVYLDSKQRKIGISGAFNYWKLIKYDNEGNKIYMQDSDGNWEKRKYDNGKIKQFSNSLGTHWVR